MIKQEFVGPALLCTALRLARSKAEGSDGNQADAASRMAGTKKLLARYGERLVCVRYRYDSATGRRVKTAELIVQDIA